MKQGIKRILILFVIFSILFTNTLPVYAKNISQQPDKKPAYVLVYHDLATGVDTMITAAEAKSKFGLNIDPETLSVCTQPQKPMGKLTEKHLTEEEIKQIEDANKNGIDEFNKCNIFAPYSNVSTKQMTASINATAESNAETRTLVANPGQYPYCSTAKIYSGNTWIGTGFAIGARVLATARHCLQDSNGWKSSLIAYFGFDNNANTYRYKAENPVAYISCPAETMTETLEDWVFVVWGEDTVSYVGHFGMTGAGYTGMPVKTMGYPQDLNGGNKMYECSGTILDCRDYDFESDLRVYPGQSGSPVYEVGADGPYAIAIMTHTWYPVNRSLARRIDSSLVEWLISNGYN